MLDMQHRAVSAVRDWNAALGPDAVYLVCSHGDVIKSVIADSLGMHLDMLQRIQIDPCSLSIIRYTPLRPFVLRLNDTGGSVDGLARQEAKRPGARAAGRDSDGAVGGGAGDAEPAGPAGERRRPATAQPTTARHHGGAAVLRRLSSGLAARRPAAELEDRTMPVFSYDPPDRFVAGTVGQPGERTFYLQASAGGRITSVALEKVQVSRLAERLDELLDDELKRSGADSAVAPARPPARPTMSRSTCRCLRSSGSASSRWPGIVTTSAS